jgi:hypothetical protein
MGLDGPWSGSRVCSGFLASPACPRSGGGQDDTRPGTGGQGRPCLSAAVKWWSRCSKTRHRQTRPAATSTGRAMVIEGNAWRREPSLGNRLFWQGAARSPARSWLSAAPGGTPRPPGGTPLPSPTPVVGGPQGPDRGSWGAARGRRKKARGLIAPRRRTKHRTAAPTSPSDHCKDRSRYQGVGGPRFFEKARGRAPWRGPGRNETPGRSAVRPVRPAALLLAPSGWTG